MPSFLHASRVLPHAISSSTRISYLSTIGKATLPGFGQNFQNSHYKHDYPVLKASMSRRSINSCAQIKPSPSGAIISSSSDLVRPHAAKSTRELMNAISVLLLCQVRPLVHYTPQLLSLAKSMGALPLVHAAIKATLFKHFCGGENLAEVLPTMSKLKAQGIGSILDLAIEADVDTAAAGGIDARSAAAQTHHIIRLMCECIDIAKEQPNSFIAAKVTALIPPVLLQRWSNVLKSLRQEWAAGRLAQFPGITSIDIETMCGEDKSKTLDWIDVSEYYSLHRPEQLLKLLTALQAKGHSSPVQDPLTLIDLDTIQLLLPQIYTFVEYAKRANVQMMLDAEQTYLQPAIDDVALGLAARFNTKCANVATATGGPVIYNTYQMYLKDGLSRLEQDLERSRRGGYAFGVKMVRGAYLETERRLATAGGYPSPVHDDIQATHDSHNAGIRLLVSHVKGAGRGDVSFVVASHNNASVDLTRSLMQDRSIPSTHPGIGFAQLYGMKDGLSASLAKGGYSIFKYLPYGPLDVTIPYLHRRAIENSAVLGGAGEDLRALRAELMGRLRGQHR